MKKKNINDKWLKDAPLYNIRNDVYTKHIK